MHRAAGLFRHRRKDQRMDHREKRRWNRNILLLVLVPVLIAAILFGMTGRGPKPEKAIAVTAHVGEDGVYRFIDEEGRWLVSASGGGLSLTRKRAQRLLIASLTVSGKPVALSLKLLDLPLNGNQLVRSFLLRALFR